MSRYTDKLVATLRQRYEGSKQSMHAIAAEFDISTRTLQRLVTQEGWSKRSLRPRGLPVAVQLLAEAQALAAVSPPPERGRSDCEAIRVGVKQDETPSPTLPLSGGGSTASAIDRIEALVVQAIEAEETTRAQPGGRRRGATACERSARTLATLTQTLQTLQRLRAGAPGAEPIYIDDDDLPRDIDEFRRDLARRIDAFVASRTDATDAGADSEPEPLDDAG